MLAQRHDLRHSVRRRRIAAVNQDRRGLLPDRLLPNRVTSSTRLLRCIRTNHPNFWETNSNKEHLPTIGHIVHGKEVLISAAELQLPCCQGKLEELLKVVNKISSPTISAN